MSVKVKKVVLWRKKVSNRPGELWKTLDPLSKSNLRVVMGYGIPDDPRRAVIELFPITGAAASKAARKAGLRPSPIPCVLAEGDDRAGLGRDMAKRLAGAGVNISFLMAETIGRKFSAVFGFESDADARTAMREIKSAAKR
jgi:hypothetical protein